MKPWSEEFLEGVQLFNLGKYWEAHEAWEIPWGQARAQGDEQEACFVQGLILYAAAIHKARHGGSLRGGQRNLEKARRKLSSLMPKHHGLDLGVLDTLVERALVDQALRPQLRF